MRTNRAVRKPKRDISHTVEIASDAKAMNVKITITADQLQMISN